MTLGVTKTMHHPLAPLRYGLLLQSLTRRQTTTLHRQGQLFKADGEVVGYTAGSGIRLSPYNLACDVQPTSHANTAADASGTSERQSSKDQENLKQQEMQQQQEVKARQRARQELQQKAKEAHQKVCCAEKQLAAARQEQAARQEAVHTAERSIASLKRRLAAAAAPGKMQQQEQMEQEVQAVEHRHAAAFMCLEAQPAAANAAKDLAASVQAEYEAACAAAEGGNERLHAEQAARAADEAWATAEAALAQTRQQVKRVRTQVASVKRELGALGQKDWQAEANKHRVSA